MCGALEILWKRNTLAQAVLYYLDFIWNGAKKKTKKQPEVPLSEPHLLGVRTIKAVARLLAQQTVHTRMSLRCAY